MGKVTYITEEGLRKMKEELDRMVKIERPSISKAIGEAIEKGDISENAEYDAAKDAQGMLEAKIAVLSAKIASARIIDATMQYIIVSEPEADLKLGKISIQTPIAKGLMGKKIGDVVEIQVPSGTIPFEIVDIAM